MKLVSATQMPPLDFSVSSNEKTILLTHDDEIIMIGKNGEPRRYIFHSVIEPYFPKQDEIK